MSTAKKEDENAKDAEARGPEQPTTGSTGETTATAGESALLTEVTSLLRSLRSSGQGAEQRGPAVRVAYVKKLDPTENTSYLLDGGATHPLRQCRNRAESETSCRWYEDYKSLGRGFHRHGNVHFRSGRRMTQCRTTRWATGKLRWILGWSRLQRLRLRRRRVLAQEWKEFLKEAKDVGEMKTLTFVHPVKSRSAKDILYGITRIYARIQALQIPILRAHMDREKSLCLERGDRMDGTTRPVLYVHGRGRTVWECPSGEGDWSTSRPLQSFDEVYKVGPGTLGVSLPTGWGRATS